MNATTRKWLHGLVAALIGGGASSVSGGCANMAVDPKEFNLSNGLGHLMITMGVTFVFAGLMSAFAYLKQSPLPPDDDPTVPCVAGRP